MQKLCSLVSDFILPPLCHNCKRLVQAHNTLCFHCWQKLEFVGYDPYLPETIFSVAYFSGLAREMVHKLKFEDDVKLALCMAKLMALRVPKHPDSVLIPVPMHINKLRERGYNQAGLLASMIGKLNKMPCEIGVLSKKRDTKNQSSLNYNERKKNILGAFAIDKMYAATIINSHVIIVDDVCTTKATINECSKILIKAGAKSVSAVVFAVTRP